MLLLVVITDRLLRTDLVIGLILAVAQAGSTVFLTAQVSFALAFGPSRRNVEPMNHRLDPIQGEVYASRRAQSGSRTADMKPAVSFGLGAALGILAGAGACLPFLGRLALRQTRSRLGKSAPRLPRCRVDGPILSP